MKEQCLEIILKKEFSFFNHEKKLVIHCKVGESCFRKMVIGFDRTYEIDMIDHIFGILASRATTFILTIICAFNDKHEFYTVFYRVLTCLFCQFLMFR